MRALLVACIRAVDASLDSIRVVLADEPGAPGAHWRVGDEEAPSLATSQKPRLPKWTHLAQAIPFSENPVAKVTTLQRRLS